MTDQSIALTTAGKAASGGNSLIEQVARKARVAPSVSSPVFSD